MARKALKNKRKLGWKGQMLLIFIVLLGAVFLPTTVLLVVSMLPTMAASVIDKTQGKARTLTIGAMNLAGCFPFIVELWLRGHTMEIALQYLMQPRTVVMIYFAAALGYLIDWAMTGIVSAVMVQKARERLRAIDKEQEALVERWGKEVTGKIPLDPYGFAVPQESPPQD